MPVAPRNNAQQPDPEIETRTEMIHFLFGSSLTGRVKSKSSTVGHITEEAFPVLSSCSAPSLLSSLSCYRYRLL